MKQRSLFNIGRNSEILQGITGAYRALAKGINHIFRGRTCERRVNAKGKAYIEVPAYFTVMFRVYEPDQDGKSTIMAIIKDLFANAGERNGQTLYDNPVLWGRVMPNQNVFFFNDPSPREVLEDYKRQLISKGLVDESSLEG